MKRGRSLILVTLVCLLSLKWNTAQAQINQLVSKNTAPVLQMGRKPPVFAEGYDWEEQERVWQAFVVCARDSKEESWEELLKHLDDKRYAITIKQELSYPQNCSVGELCRKLAMYRLYTLLERHSTTSAIKHARVIPDPGITDLAEWRAKRAGKNLVELQIEAAELGLAKVADLRQISAEDQAKMSRAIEAAIKHLKDSQMPLFDRFPLGMYPPIDELGRTSDD